MAASYDLIVVGEGLAGLICASECAKLGLKVATFEAEFFGGLVVNVNELAQFEEANGLSGMDYAGLLASGNKKAGIKSNSSTVTAIRTTDGAFTIEGGSNSYTARFVVIATGAHIKKLGVPGETEYEGRGVSHCADCDAPMFTEAEVVVAGSGNWAVQDALLLARDCSTVHLVYSDSELIACSEYCDAAKAEPKIILHPGTQILEVLGGDSGMTGVRVKVARGGAQDIAATGLFAVPGLEPNSAIAPEAVLRDSANHLVVNDELETAVSGLWAIGQVRSGFPGWMKDAASDALRVAAQIGARTS